MDVDDVEGRGRGGRFCDGGIVDIVKVIIIGGRIICICKVTNQSNGDIRFLNFASIYFWGILGWGTWYLAVIGHFESKVSYLGCCKCHVSLAFHLTIFFNSGTMRKAMEGL